MAIQRTIKIRRDTSANWTSNNPTPAEGELCLETDSGRLKIGDGITAWTSLPHLESHFEAVNATSYQVSDTPVIDASRNIVNAGSGSFTSTVTATNFIVPNVGGLQASNGNAETNMNIEFPDITTANGFFRFGRVTNTSGALNTIFYKGDGTNTPMVTVDHKLGNITAKNFIGQAAQTITYSATPTQNWTSGNNATITLTGDVTTYTLSNVPDGGSGEIRVLQNATGGYGITAFAHTGLAVDYIDGLAPTAANINSVANGVTYISYKRVGSFLAISYAGF